MARHQMLWTIHTDSVNILRDTPMHGTGQVVIDDMKDVDDIKSTSRNSSCDHDRAFGAAEGTAV
jgi:hypothetical protein